MNIEINGGVAVLRALLIAQVYSGSSRNTDDLANALIVADNILALCNLDYDPDEAEG